MEELCFKQSDLSNLIGLENFVAAVFSIIAGLGGGGGGGGGNPHFCILPMKASLPLLLLEVGN